MKSGIQPESLVAPALFWFWNDTPDADGIRRQLDAFSSKGIRAVYIHPMPADFRRHDFHEGMDVPYLSDRFFELVALACAEIKSRNMTLWLYDEGGWPSGVAGGAVVAENPDFGLWALERSDGLTRPVQFLPELNYPDLMNRAATLCFIRTTHEKYRQFIGDEFGRTVPGIFTDEPRLTGRLGTRRIPWSPKLPDAFRADHGMELEDVLDHLFESDLPEDVVFPHRRRYLETVSRLVAESYFQPIREWCERNGLLFEGHHSGEDDFARHGTYFGHFLRQAGHYHIPGVDAIWRQIFPGVAKGNYVGLAASSAWLRGGRVALSESFAVYGAGLTLDQMRWIAGYQIVRGVNKIGIMATLYSAGGARRISTCSDISPKNPIWADVDLLIEHLHQAASFSLRGSLPPVVGLFYRTELLGSAQAEDEFTAGHEALCERIHDQLTSLMFVGLDELRNGRLHGGRLDLGHVQIAALVVNTASPLSEDEWAAMERAARGGLRIVWAGDPKGWEAFRGRLGPASGHGVEWAGDPTALDLSSLSPLVTEGRVRGVRVLTYDEGGRVGGFLFFNQSDAPVELAFRVRALPDGFGLTELPIEDDSSLLLHPLQRRNGGYALHLHPGQMRALVAGKDAAGGPEEQWELTQRVAVNGTWEVTEVEEFGIEDDIEVRPVQRRALAGGLGDYSAQRPDFVGSLSYRAWLNLPPAPASRVLLDLGTVCYSAGVTVNGQDCGRRAWAPFLFDVTAALQNGRNRLEIRVTTTLANQWARPDVRERDFRLWRNNYLDKTESFINESCHAGLLGPVEALVLKRKEAST